MSEQLGWGQGECRSWEGRNRGRAGDLSSWTPMFWASTRASTWQDPGQALGAQEREEL